MRLSLASKDSCSWTPGRYLCDERSDHASVEHGQLHLQPCLVQGSAGWGEHRDQARHGHGDIQGVVARSIRLVREEREGGDKEKDLILFCSTFKSSFHSQTLLHKVSRVLLLVFEQVRNNLTMYHNLSEMF